MLPVLFRVGGLPVPTYGLVSVLALLASIAVVRRLGRREGLDPGMITDGVVLISAAGLVGSRLLDVLVSWDRIAARPGDLVTVLLSGGTYLGAFLTAIPTTIWWFRRHGAAAAQGLDLMAVVAVVSRAVGRWGCFASGCCWGTPTDLPWGVVFPEAGRRIHPGLPDVPVHPTQIYLSLGSVALFMVLLAVYPRKRFHGQIAMLYLLLYAPLRFALENLRGDLERGFVLGGLLSTSQFLSLFLVIGGAGGYLYLRKRGTATQFQSR